MSCDSCQAGKGRDRNFGFWLFALMLTALDPGTASAQDNADLAGVYVGEQPGAYMQNRMSSRAAYLFSAHAINSDYWVSADIKLYLGDYADSIYVNSGITHAREQGFPAQTIYRVGGGWEIKTEGHTVWGVGSSVWWNEAWPEPVVRSGIYIAFYR